MGGRIFAILIYDRPGPMDLLKLALKDLSVETFSVQTLEEARRLISQTHPFLIFTARSVGDGSWLDVINLAERADIPLAIFVVSANKDFRFYSAAFERGAFGFLYPPFEPQALDMAVHSAEQNVRHRRQALARLAVP